MKLSTVELQNAYRITTNTKLLLECYKSGDGGHLQDDLYYSILRVIESNMLSWTEHGVRTMTTRITV
jgi:hypothetical protein